MKFPKPFYARKLSDKERWKNEERQKRYQRTKANKDYEKEDETSLDLVDLMDPENQTTEEPPYSIEDWNGEESDED